MQIAQIFSIARLGPNLARLLATFGFGALTLWGFGRLGPEPLAAYLFLLGLRWMASIPALGLEAAAVPLIASGQARTLRVWTIGITTAVLLVFCIATSIAVSVAPPGQGWGQLVICSGLWAAFQTATAPAMARLLIARHFGWHAGLFAARRAVDLVALAGAVVITAGGDPVMDRYLAIVTPLAAVIAMATLVIAGHRPLVTPKMPLPAAQTIAASVAICASQIVSLRFPVLAASLFLPPPLAVPFGLVFVIAGYCRQAMTAVLIGLDADFSRQPAAAVMTLFRQSTLGVLILMIATCSAVAVGLPFVMSIVMPVAMDLPDQTAILGIVVLSGVGLRIVADLWLKLLSGRGAQRAVLPSVTLHTGLQFALTCLLAAYAPEHFAIMAIAAGFLLGQILLLWSLARAVWRLFPEPASAEPSLPAE